MASTAISTIPTVTPTSTITLAIASVYVPRESILPRKRSAPEDVTMEPMLKRPRASVWLY
jgi:hypothetical protein